MHAAMRAGTATAVAAGRTARIAGARAISVRATREAATRQQQRDEDAKPKPPRKPAPLDKRFTASVQVRPADTPLHVQRRCGVLVRALAESNPRLALEQYTGLADDGHVGVLSMEELLELFRLLVSSQAVAKPVDRRVLDVLDGLMGSLIERAEREAVRLGGPSMLPPQLFHMLMQCRGALNETTAVERIWDFVVGSGVPATTEMLNTVLEQHARDGNAAAANALIEQCIDEGIAMPNITSFAALIRAFGRSKSPESASASLSVLDRVQESGLPMHITLFNSLILTLAKAGQMDQIKHVLTLMAERRFKPSTVTYNNIIHGFVEARRFDEAVATYKQMVEDAASSDVRREQCAPDSTTFSILMGIYTKQRQPELAVQLLEEMSKHNIKITTIPLTIVMSAYRAVGNLDGVRRYFDMISELFLDYDEVAFSTMMGAYVDKRQYEAALAAYQQMLEHRISPRQTSYGLLIEIHTARGDFEACKAAFDEIRTRGLAIDSHLLELMLRAAAAMRQPSQCAQTYFDMAGKLGLPITRKLFHRLLIAYLADSTKSLGESVEQVIYEQMKPRNFAADARTLEILLNFVVRPDLFERKHLGQRLLSATSRAEALAVSLAESGRPVGEADEGDHEAPGEDMDDGVVHFAQHRVDQEDRPTTVFTKHDMAMLQKVVNDVLDADDRGTKVQRLRELVDLAIARMRK
ncbi:hypothetical protein HK105_204400 [Polyrhizophydium stewartii]|uniref:Uncharacterized protein n=1 Tax=Polyrhizophydium stewartii TaxID=2732419 RepID=A0ABR4N939_9FUNG